MTPWAGQQVFTSRLTGVLPVLSAGGNKTQGCWQPPLTLSEGDYPRMEGTWEAHSQGKVIQQALTRKIQGVGWTCKLAGDCSTPRTSAFALVL